MTSKLSLKKHKWALDFSSKHRADGSRQIVESLPDPPGYSNCMFADSNQRENNKTDLVEKRSWDVALGPLKQIPMNLFIMWMAGNSVTIFPIMMVGMMLVRPIQALLSIKQTFKNIEGKNSILQKIVYLFGNIAGVGLAVYKCNSMGLLPLHASDWLAFAEPPQRLEWTVGGMKL